MGTNAIEIREIILTHRQQNFERCGLEVETFDARWIIAQRGGRAVLDEVGKLFNECRGLDRARGSLAAEREEFLELIERQERSDEIVSCAPEMVSFAVKIFPQRLVRPRQWRLDPRG